MILLSWGMIDDRKERERQMLEGFEAWVRHGTPFGLYHPRPQPIRIKLWVREIDD